MLIWPSLDHKAQTKDVLSETLRFKGCQAAVCPTLLNTLQRSIDRVSLDWYLKKRVLFKNDPHAGSPTSTLLRLLPLLDWKYCLISAKHELPHASPPESSTYNPSQATTGGVYKNQGRILCVLMKRGYKIFLVHGE